jgi:hypothetical protein
MRGPLSAYPATSSTQRQHDRPLRTTPLLFASHPFVRTLLEVFQPMHVLNHEVPRPPMSSLPATLAVHLHDPCTHTLTIDGYLCSKEAVV